MNASELIRKLLYCGYNDVADHFKNNPQNRYFYMEFLSLQPRYGIKNDVLKILNEVNFQLVHIQTDRKPGIDVRNRFIHECREWLASDDDAMLVFAIVKAHYGMKEKLSFEEECFWKQFDPLIYNNRFESVTCDMVNVMRNEGYKVPERYEIMHTPFLDMDCHPTKRHSPFYWALRQLLYSDEANRYLDEYLDSWEVITDNFTPKAIEWLLNLYSTTKEKMDILAHIESICPPHWKYENNLDFDVIRKRLNDESEKNELIFTDISDGEEYDRMFAAGYEQTMAEAENDKDEQYKQERDALRCQLEEQRKSYEAKMAERELLFQTEMEAMRKELLAKCEEVAAKQEKMTKLETQEASREFSLTVAEMSEYVKEFFNEEAANQFINMYYHFAIRYDKVTGDASKIMDGIIPAIHKRYTPQTHVDITNAQQVNVSPQEVHNHTLSSR